MFPDFSEGSARFLKVRKFKNQKPLAGKFRVSPKTWALQFGLEKKRKTGAHCKLAPQNTGETFKDASEKVLGYELGWPKLAGTWGGSDGVKLNLSPSST